MQPDTSVSRNFTEDREFILKIEILLEEEERWKNRPIPKITRILFSFFPNIYYELIYYCIKMLAAMMYFKMC